MTAALSLALTPHGHLVLVPSADAPTLPRELQQRLERTFERVAQRTGCWIWGCVRSAPRCRQCSRSGATSVPRYVTTLCTSAEPTATDKALNAIAAPTPGRARRARGDSTPDGRRRVPRRPTSSQSLWEQVDRACRAERGESKNSLQEFLKSLHPVWNLVGRVHFNLAENRKDAEAPFAFLATYTSRVSSHGKAQHLPLSQALTEFSDGKSQARLLSLLMPVQRAAEQCAWLRAMVESGEIYHPLRWLPADAYQFLDDVPKLEAAGIIVRAPGAWQAGRPARPLVKASIGAQTPSLLGKDALLDFSIEVTLDGERLDAAEIKMLLAGGDGLHLLRGRWVEVDRKRLGRMLERFQAIERAAAEHGLPFAEAMRLLAGGLARRGRQFRRCRLVATGRRPVAGRYVAGIAPAGGPCAGQPRGRTQDHVAPVSAGRRPLAVPAHPAAGWGRALPMTWAWARPSRCSLCS